MKLQHITLSLLLFPAFLLLSIVFFVIITMSVTNIAKENQTYDRFNSCVLSVPALDRDKNRIDHCWESAEQDTGIQVKQYDP